MGGLGGGRGGGGSDRGDASEGRCFRKICATCSASSGELAAKMRPRSDAPPSASRHPPGVGAITGSFGPNLTWFEFQEGPFGAHGGDLCSTTVEVCFLQRYDCKDPSPPKLRGSLLLPFDKNGQGIKGSFKLRVGSMTG